METEHAMGIRSLLSFLAVLSFSVAGAGQEKLERDDGPLATFGRPYVLGTTNALLHQPEPELQRAVQLGPIIELVPLEPVPENAAPVAGPAASPVTYPAMSFNPPRATPGNSGRFWATAEYGIWSLRGDHLPPLVTFSPASATRANAGVLGGPGTSILIGDERANDDARSGGRFTFGAWLNPQQTWGLEAGFWFLEGQRHRWAAGSDGSQIIARPFIDAQTGAQAAELVSFPGLLAGRATVTARSDPLYGADLLLRKSLCSGCDGRVDLLAGYRFLRLDESLQIQERLTSLDPAALGANLIVTDHFATRNEFHGGELGMQAEWWRGNFSLQLLGKLAVGNLHRQVHIDGSTVVSVAGFAPVVGSGGLLALSSNSGNFASDRVAWIPEIGITSGWQITPRLRATLGYTFLYWPGVVRPGDQIDPVINTNLLPPPVPGGPARPAFVLRESDMWIQGVRLGLEYRY
jgi:hypothetical protein